MPTGVASHFLDILGADRRSARTKLVVTLLWAAVLAGLAWVLAPGWLGLVTHAAGLAGGVLVGLLLGRVAVRRYERSIRGTWTQWMRYAVAAESVPELHRKVRGRSGRNLPYMYAAVLTLVWGSEVALLALAIASSDDAAPLALPVIAFNALLAGGLFGNFAVLRRWTTAFAASVRDMVESGEINMWGVA